MGWDCVGLEQSHVNTEFQERDGMVGFFAMYWC